MVSICMILFEGVILFKAREEFWILIELLIVFCLSKKRIRFTFIYFLSRCFLFLFVKNLVDGEIVSGVYYVAFNNASWILVLLFLLFLDSLLLYDKRGQLYSDELRYPITLKVKDRCIDMIGYLDTGNKSTNSKIPIIVLNEIFLDYFDMEESVELMIGSVNSFTREKAFLCELSIEKGVFQKVWVIFSNRLAGIDCLLNIYNI